jgi:hypothetical protein
VRLKAFYATNESAWLMGKVSKMSTPSTDSEIRDIHRRGIVADFLKAKILFGYRLSIASTYFTIYAYRDEN